MFSTSRPQCSNKRFAPNVRTVNDAMYKHNTIGSRTGYQQELKLKLLRWVREGLSNAILTDCKGMLNYQSHYFILKIFYF
jgi:hypothetical protein